MKDQKTGQQIYNEEIRDKVNKYMPMLEELTNILYVERKKANIAIIRTSRCDIYFKF